MVFANSEEEKSYTNRVSCQFEIILWKGEKSKPLKNDYILLTKNNRTKVIHIWVAIFHVFQFKIIIVSRWQKLITRVSYKWFPSVAGLPNLYLGIDEHEKFKAIFTPKEQGKMGGFKDSWRGCKPRRQV